MQFEEYLTWYEGYRRTTGGALSPDEFYANVTKMRGEMAPQEQLIWESQVAAEKLYLQHKRPYVKVYPAYVCSVSHEMSLLADLI